MNKIIWLIKQSLILDFKFIKISNWSFIKKIKFLIVKYRLLIRHFFKKFELRKDYIKLFGEKIYYDSCYGLAGYQSMLVRPQKMIKIAQIDKVSTVIDIGANVGFFSKLIRDLFPKSIIYCIEPIPSIFKRLQLNFQHDPKAKLFKIAISDKFGNARMSFDNNNSAISYINNKGNVKVKLDTLDNFISKNKISQIDILKIDTEGFENHVLKGGQKALAITKYLFLEISIKDNPNYTISHLLSLLYSKSFNFQLVAFRNYADTGEGEMPIMDCLFKNVKKTDR